MRNIFDVALFVIILKVSQKQDTDGQLGKCITYAQFLTLSHM